MCKVKKKKITFLKETVKKIIYYQQHQQQQKRKRKLNAIDIKVEITMALPMT